MKKSLAAFLFFILAYVSIPACYGQELTDFPQDLSFFVLKENKKCLVSFKVEGQKGDKLKLEVSKDGLKLQELNREVDESLLLNFSTSIDAGLHDYNFQLYKDDSLLKSAEKVLCGEAILIYGQSNGLAIAGVDEYERSYDDRWTRNFTLTDIYAKGGWYPAKDPFAEVGVLGLSLAEHFVKQDKMPIAIINGSVGGQNIDQLSERNLENPKDRSTLYGHFLSRLDSASTIDKVKAFIWVQGEAETSAGEAAMKAYPQKFDKLYKNIQSDFPPIDRFIVIQNTLMAEGIGEAGIIRNAQSDFMDTYPEITTLASVGQTDSFDGVHYGRSGYERLAWLVYNNLKNPDMASPKLRGVIQDLGSGYIRLVFDEGYKMELLRVRNLWYKQRVFDSFLFINGQNYQLNSLKTVRNEVWLEVKDIKNVETITYLPSFFSDEFTRHYDGPTIKAQNGYSALTFYNARITEVKKQQPRRLLPLLSLPPIIEWFKGSLPIKKQQTIK